MQVEFEYREDVCILRLTGRFVTGADMTYLRSKADEIKKGGCGKVLADFTNVPYIDSTGIAFVVGLYTSLTNAGGRFVLAAPSPRVREVLELTRLNTIIPIVPDETSALAELREAPRTKSADRK
jgi:anti-anti-sigma factor